MPEKHAPGNEGTDRDDRALIDAARGQVEDALERQRQRDRTPPTHTAQEAEPAFDGPPTDSFTGYKIIDEIHRGGQGVVYKALQESTKRKVAIKVMKEGPFAGSSEKARFEREIQILGQLKHPNIVTVYDSGTAAGSFYFVMDYISGQALDVYMSRKEHSIDETLGLFGKICEAVNAAHLHGVIHRDLKPGNIRVDPNGEPHILDFGLAKVAAGGVSAMTMTGQFIGSLPWASPEQAEGVPSKIDVRTDVYSLGVILYQMLTGKFPYDVIGNMRDVLERIMKAEPARPSTIRKQINDEVETIVLKCLSKERERRYQTAGELARDVGLYLAGEPIEAKRDSFGYVLRKQLRRYRVPAATAAAFVVLLIAGTVVSTTMYVRAEEQTRLAQLAGDAERKERIAADAARKDAEKAEHEQRRLAAAESAARHEAEEARDAESEQRKLAEQQRDKAEKINAFVTKALVSSDPNQGGAQGFLVTDAMKQAVALLDAGELKDQPEMEADLLLTISGILNGNAQSAEALRLARRALDINEQLHPGDHPDVAQGLNNVAACLDSLGRSVEALPKHEAALEMKQRLFEGDHPDVASSLNNVAYCLNLLGRSTEALPKYEAALEMNQRLFEGDHPDVAMSLNSVAYCLRSLGRPAEALPKFVASLAMYQRLFEGDHPDVARSLNNVAACLQSLGRPAEALPKYEAALEVRQRLFEGDHPDVANSLYNVADCLDSLARSADALPKYEAALEMLQRALPPGHPHTLYPQIGLAKTLVALGRYAEAEPLLLDAAEQCERSEQSRRMHWLSVIKASARLYDSWHEAEPDKGYDAKAAEWRAKLPSETTTQPASQPPSVPEP